MTLRRQRKAEIIKQKRSLLYKKTANQSYNQLTVVDDDNELASIVSTPVPHHSYKV